MCLEQANAVSQTTASSVTVEDSEPEAQNPQVVPFKRD
jgi:hypothetical protein